MAQNGPGGRGGRRSPPGTDAKANRYRTFSNVNQAFSVKKKNENGLPDIDRETDLTEIQFTVKEGDNEVRLRLDRVPNGRVILLDSAGFQYDIYLRADRWSFNCLRDGIIIARFI